MKKPRIILFSGLFITTIVLLGYVFYVPYYVDDSGLYISLFDADMHLAARVFMLVILTWISVILSVIFSWLKPSLMYNQSIYYFFKIIPIFLLISLVTWFVFGLFIQMSEYDIMQLGYDFVNANMSHYPETITHADIVIIGQSLNSGIGKYLLWVIFILLIGEYTWYYKNFNRIFNIEDNI